VKAYIRYAEIKHLGLWYAQQQREDYGMILERRSIYGYEERAELVAALAFGNHTWTAWRKCIDKPATPE
jgi:hypothetical protein